MIPDYSMPANDWKTYAGYMEIAYDDLYKKGYDRLRDYEDHFTDGTHWEVEYDVPGNPVTLTYALSPEGYGLGPTYTLCCISSLHPEETVTLGSIATYLSDVSFFPADRENSPGGLLYFFRNHINGSKGETHRRFSINPLAPAAGITQETVEVRYLTDEEETPGMPDNYSLNVVYYPDKSSHRPSGEDKWIKGIGSVSGFFTPIADGKEVPARLKRVYDAGGDIYRALSAGVGLTADTPALRITALPHGVEADGGLPGEEIALYSVAGMKAASSYSGRLTASGLPAGVYIILHAGRSLKITVN
ncbi:MAG: hypothetical protein HDR80_06185 [Bacteroides sp.]|nr:hypothetical protein [Bacteroides sp.]